MSDALLALKDNFRLFEYPDPVRKTMLEVWPLTCPRRSLHLILYKIKWKVLEFFKIYFPQGQCLGDVLIITSKTGSVEDRDALNAQETFCRDYLSRI